MRRLVVAACLAIALAPLAHAQKPGRTVGDFVETYRPQIQKRPLTAEEKTALKDISGVLKKTNSLTEAQARTLHAIANTGDMAAMRAMHDAYNSRQQLETDIIGIGGYGSGDVQAWRALAGLWAMALWREGERSNKLAEEIHYCLLSPSNSISIYNKGFRCGFGARIESDYDHDLSRYARREKGSKPPIKIEFEEWSMAPKLTPEQEQERFKTLLAKWSNGQNGEGDDTIWFNNWIVKQGPEIHAQWSEANEKYWARKNAAIGAERVAQEDAAKARVVRWDALNTARTEAKAKGAALPPPEEEEFVRLSFQLKGRHIVPIGTERVLMERWQRDDFCQYAPADICERQRELARAREDAATAEAVAKANAWKVDGSRGDVTVRSYDQNGNYLGTSKMPAWQADILTGN